MLQKFSADEVAAKLGSDPAELGFLQVHFREFLSGGADGAGTFNGGDLALLERVVQLLRHDKMPPAEVQTLLRGEMRGQGASGHCQHGVLGFGSGRPGSGKSALVYNLGAALAARGYRVTLFDGSISRGGVGELLSKADVISDQPGKWRHELAPGLDLLWGEKLFAAPGDADFDSLLESARGSFSTMSAGSDFLLIDSGEGRSDSVLRFAMVCDETIEVTTTDVGGNADTFAVIRMLKDVNPEARIGVVINRARSLGEAREAFSRINGAAGKVGMGGLSSLGWVEEDDALSRYMAQGKAVVTALPTSAASRCIGRMADYLVHRLMPLPTRPQANPVAAAVEALRNSLERRRTQGVITGT